MLRYFDSMRYGILSRVAKYRFFLQLLKGGKVKKFCLSGKRKPPIQLRKNTSEGNESSGKEKNNFPS